MKEIYVKKATEIADLMDRARNADGRYYDEAMDILEIGNSWTMYLSRIESLLDRAFRGLVERPSLIASLVNVFDEFDVEFSEHTDASVYVSDFECEHDGDMEGERERFTEAGARIVKTKWNECEETGYIFFSVPVANVERFEKEHGRIWRFRKVA